MGTAIPTTRNKSLPQGTSDSGLCWCGERMTILNCSFVRLRNKVQHGRDLLGRRLGWEGIEHAISDSDEGREKGGNNLNVWQNVSFLVESTR